MSTCVTEGTGQDSRSGLRLEHDAIVLQSHRISVKAGDAGVENALHTSLGNFRGGSATCSRIKFP